MKTFFIIFIVVLVVAALGGTMYFLYSKSQEPQLVFKTDSPFVTSIVNKTVATGSIVPREEITVKSSVSGIIEKLFAEPGQRIRKGELIARIRIIPDLVNLNNAEARVRTAEINLQNARRELLRSEKLFENKIISEEEFNRFELDVTLREEELNVAESNVQLIKEGASKKTGTGNNLVYSTASGTILEVPVKEGETVIEANSFNEGTTVAAIADMSDLIFLGLVDESEVGKIEVGMPLDIKIGALERLRFRGVLEYIAPKGVDQEGTVQFEVKAAVDGSDEATIRANYSANADIVLERRDSVLAIREAWLQFAKDSTFVEILVNETPQVFERRTVQTGLSDGIKIEVTAGIDSNAKIKSGKGVPAG